MPRPVRGHELIEHTADVGLHLWAPTRAELFVEGAVGLVDVMGSAPGPGDRVERVDLEAGDVDALFVDWLSEVLFLFDARGFVVTDASVEMDPGDQRMRATLRGADAAVFVQHGPAVKAVTYHALDIRQTAAGYEADVYLDV